MLPSELNAPLAWQVFTRLGESMLLMPAVALVLVSLWRHEPGRALARQWLMALTVAVALVTASKLAFIGWGLGWAALDFTGFSGHSMFAAAVHPLLFGALAPVRHPAARRMAVTAGLLLAAMVGVSRVVVGAHSVSEVVSGLAIGLAVGVLAYGLGRLRVRWQAAAWMLPLVAAWLLAMPWLAPHSPTHSVVTRLALALSGHSVPYTRADLHAARAAAPR